jgi:DNA-directed RNA polymerase subunit M/transcription elongation factor TFIIS
MKNTIYAVVIVACIVVAATVFVTTRSKKSGGVESLSDTQQVWVKCMKCGQSYQMSMKQYYKELEEKMKANPSPMPIAHPLTCQKCGQDAVRKAFKCPNCGEVSFEGSVPGDFPDRCPKCKHSATEDSRKANLQGRQAE